MTATSAPFYPNAGPIVGRDEVGLAHEVEDVLGGHVVFALEDGHLQEFFARLLPLAVDVEFETLGEGILEFLLIIIIRLSQAGPQYSPL